MIVRHDGGGPAGLVRSATGEYRSKRSKRSARICLGWARAMCTGGSRLSDRGLLGSVATTMLPVSATRHSTLEMPTSAANRESRNKAAGASIDVISKPEERN